MSNAASDRKTTGSVEDDDEPDDWLVQSCGRSLISTLTAY